MKVMLKKSGDVPRLLNHNVFSDRIFVGTVSVL